MNKPYESSHNVNANTHKYSDFFVLMRYLLHKNHSSITDSDDPRMRHSAIRSVAIVFALRLAQYVILSLVMNLSVSFSDDYWEGILDAHFDLHAVNRDSGEFSLQNNRRMMEIYRSFYL